MSALDRVLACRSLPTLPAVAVEVLRLTRDPDTSLKQIAKAVRSDQGLAAKALRTVNSPLYGLRQPCKTIDRALAHLGQNTVKSIVLGFSLMDSAREAPRGFGMDVYWKRVISSAAAARQVAALSGVCDPDEAFTGGLFQDMGMLAIAMALPDEYGALLSEAERHEALPRLERGALQFDHAEAGALLAERWGLPELTIDCVRYHHAPEDAPAGHRPVVSCVAFGRLLARELLAPAPERRLSDLAARFVAWFGAAPVDMAQLVSRAAEDGAEMARLFETSAAEVADIEAIMTEAQEQLALHQMSIGRQAEQLLAETMTDGLTGVGSRKGFDRALDTMFERAQAERAALTAIFLDFDHFKAINDTHGHAVGDAVLIELAARMARAVGPRGNVFRYGGEEFAILAPGLAPEEALALAEAVREAARRAPVDLRGVEGRAPGEPDEVAVTISLGVATHLPQAPAPGARALVRAADNALYESKRAGRDRVTAASPAGPARSDGAGAPAGHAGQTSHGASGAARPLRMLLVEDDPLAAAVIRARLARRPEIDVQWEQTRAGATEFISACLRGVEQAPDLVLCDLFLDGAESGADVIRAIRASAALAHIPIWAMSASEAGEDVRACMDAGATQFRSKRAIIASLSGWVDELLASARAAA